jgi:hypothetical protein
VETAEILNFCNTLLLFLILSRMLIKRLSRQYPVVLIYFLYSALNSLVANLIYLMAGLESEIYRVHYYSYSILMPVLQIWVLLDLLKNALSLGFERQRIALYVLVIALLLGSPLFVGLLFMPGDLSPRYQALTLVFQMMLVLLIYLYLLERRDIDLGRNFKAILGGMALLNGMQAFNFLSFVQEKIPFTIFQIGVPAIYFAALSVFLVGLWNYQPAGINPERRTLNLGIQKSLRLVINLLQPK